MRIRRLVSILPFVLLGGACGVDDVDAQAELGTDVSSVSINAEGRGLQQLKAQRPEFLQGVGEVSTKRTLVDGRGQSHERISQSIRGIPVLGGEAIIHMDANGAIASITDKFARDLKVETTPRLRAEEATANAVARAGGWDAVRSIPKAELAILPESTGARLTWRVQFEALKANGEPAIPTAFIDAETGAVALEFDNLKTGRNRNTYNTANSTRLPGTLVRNETSGPSGDAVVDQAHTNAGITYDYYWSRHGRDSYNGAGATITSTVHYDRNYVNAYWNGTQMVYGDGDGVDSGPLTVLDVVGHELTHAVTDTSSDLIYSNESGALNEAMSDVFGASIEAYRDGAVSGNTWKIGEECWTPATAGDALRYMNDPAAAGDYDYYPTRYTGTSDNGGVHWNSGIANLAFKLAVTGGTHPRGKTSNVVPALSADPITSIQQGAAIFYRANTVYLTPSSTFSDARNATVQSATDLYGAGSAAVTAINEAWNAVGVGPAKVYTVIDTKTISGARSSTTNYTYVTPTTSKAIKFEMSGGSGDADIYVKWGSAPTTTSYDCRPYASGNAESCTFDPSKQGTYYVMIRGYSAYSGVTFKVSSAQ
jgi:vibriolysin